MGVYIKGMEMPTGCHTVTITLMASGKAFVERHDCRPHTHTKEYIEYKAVPVPKHGRLINEDDVIEQIDGWLDTVGYATIGKSLSYYGELLGCITDAPTIIPADPEEEGDG